jgi:hypothetical protein
MSYPPGHYPAGRPNDEYNTDISPGDDPSWETTAYLEMSRNWHPIDACIGGTDYLRINAAEYLPQEPMELEDAWKRRVSHATFSPFVTRVAEQAAGLILRKPIQLKRKGSEDEVDQYWVDFMEDCDGHGTNLDSFVRRLLFSSIMFGHAGVLVDFPSTQPARNLALERDLGLRPYFIGPIDAKQIIGWRFPEDVPLGPLEQVRLSEVVTLPLGEFGETIERQIRVLEPGRYRVYRREATGDTTGGEWYIHQEGETSSSRVPLCITYAHKIAEMVSKPPLLSLANLNISHAQRNADLQHALHVSAMPIMVLQGFDDAPDPAGLSVNNAILLPPEGNAFMVEPASQSFAAQQAYLDRLEDQMTSLGVSTLFTQKYVGETAEAKKLSRTDSDSLVTIISKDVERCLQEAFDIAGEYAGMEAPQVVLDRDFDLQVLEGHQVQQYLELWMQGAIAHETLLRALKKGEILPDLNVAEEVDEAKEEKQENMDMEQEQQIAIAENASVQPPTAPRDVE